MANDASALFKHLETLARTDSERSEAGESALLKLAGLVALSGAMTMPEDLHEQLTAWANMEDARSLDATVLLWAIASRDPNQQGQCATFLDRLAITVDDSLETIRSKSTAQLRAMDFSIAFEGDDWKQLLAGLQQRILDQRDPALTGVVLQWMHRHQQYAEVMEAAARLAVSLTPLPDDEEETVNRIVLARILVADACARVNDWQSVGRWCEGPTWGSNEHLRSLLIARALAGASVDSVPVPAVR
ncbi:MAG: hypothetical protein O3C21_14120, partial [Verrucomicrobia bacterium]|nr:hypothetical protein [Verrucomicrobiota bacterium]